MSVPLDQLRAFDLNPRITRNPNYDEIKESIRNRGLDHPPQITQRPGEKFYIIASGGNTRLAVLNELWLETHDKKYWNVACLFRPWTSASLAQGNLHCLLGHLVENEVRGSLTFIERALAIQNAIDIYRSINNYYSPKELMQMLCEEGYSVSPTLLSVMSATIKLLLPHIPDLLYSGLSRTNIDKLLSLRSNTEKFWNKFCQELPSEHHLPLFDDIFSVALAAFNEPITTFSLEHIQDELTGLVSQTLNIDYNTVALVTDARAQTRSVLLGTEPVPELPEVSEQRSVELKYRDKPVSSRSHQQENNDDNPDSEPENNISETGDYEQDDTSGGSIPAITEQRYASEKTADTSPIATESFLDNDPLFNTPESLASLIDQTAWELAGNAGLEHLISPTETGIFDIAAPTDELSNEGKIYWQLLSFLAGKLPGSAIIWRQMLTGSATTPAGFSEETLTKIFQLILHIRHLYETQHQGAKP
ncbi:TPA: ParB N-terminal domain-containing protein [Salmonella enterica]|nr:ParB N-terminal domain-containing protein [Salmonella enterica]